MLWFIIVPRDLLGLRYSIDFLACLCNLSLNIFCANYDQTIYIICDVLIPSPTLCDCRQWTPDWLVQTWKMIPWVKERVHGVLREQVAAWSLSLFSGVVAKEKGLFGSCFKQLWVKLCCLADFGSLKKYETALKIHIIAAILSLYFHRERQSSPWLPVLHKCGKHLSLIIVLSLWL